MSDTLTKSLRVEEEHLACAMGSGSLEVLATPAVVALMENAAAAQKGFPEEQYIRFLKRRVQRLTILTSLHFHDIFDILCNNPAPRE